MNKIAKQVRGKYIMFLLRHMIDFVTTELIFNYS